MFKYYFRFSLLLSLFTDTEISTCDWPSYKITLPSIQCDIICFGRPVMTKSCHGFSNIFQFCNMQKILNPIFCEEQKVRSLSTQTKQAQQKEVKKEEHYAPSKSDSLSNSTSLLTRGQKLQKAVKEYGSTVMVFHVTISLISLGTFYLAVSRYHPILLLFPLMLKNWINFYCIYLCCVYSVVFKYLDILK